MGAGFSTCTFLFVFHWSFCASSRNGDDLMVSGHSGALTPPHSASSLHLYLATFVNAFGAGMFFPFALIYYQQVTSLSVGAIGLALTLATLTTLAMNPVTGELVDRFGSNRLVVLAQLVEAAGFIAYLSVSSSTSLFLAALLATSGTRMFYASFSTLIADLVDGSGRDRWYGLIGISQAVGGSLSGLLASLMIGSIGISGFRIIIATNAGCLVLSAVLIGLGTRSLPRPVARSKRCGYGMVFRDRVFLQIVGCNVMFMLCSMLVGLAIAIYVTEALDAPLWVVGVCGLIQTAMMLGLQSRLTRLSVDIRRTRSMLVGGLSWVVGCALLAAGVAVPASMVIPIVILGAIAFASAQLWYVPASRALAAELAPPETRGRFIATFEFSYGLAAAASPALFGLTYELSPNAPWLTMIVLVVGAMILLRHTEHEIPVGKNRPSGVRVPIEVRRCSPAIEPKNVRGWRV